MDGLTLEQKARLERLRSAIRLDRITVSFSLEDRDTMGKKKSAFYSVTSFLDKGDEGSSAMTLSEGKVAQALLSKHVIETVYGDAVRRGILDARDAALEAKAILATYDRRLAKLITSED